MEMKKMLVLEGRDAKYLIGGPGGDQRVTIKRPPFSPRSLGKKSEVASKKNGARVRSASTGRDKRSELQSRYWALLFGNLQNAVNEIYQTVECYENISSCQETILVLENYIRDFKSLAEWFKMSWDYDATPPPQRPHSLTWEIRKSNPAPRIRTKSLTSPALSGKSSPSFSGKNSPCQTNTSHGITSKLSVEETSNSTELSVTPVPLIQIKEIPEDIVENGQNKITELEQNNSVTAEDYISDRIDAASQTDFPDDCLTLVEYLEKHKNIDEIIEKDDQPTVIEIEPQLSVNEPIKLKPVEPQTPHVKTTKLPPPQTTTNPPKYSSVLNRTAPASTVMTSSSSPRTSTGIVAMRQTTRVFTSRPVQQQQSNNKMTSTQKLNPVRSSNLMFRNLMVHSGGVQNDERVKASAVVNKTKANQGKNYWIPSNVANRLTARSKTMIDIDSRKNNRLHQFDSRNSLSSKKSSCESSSSTLIASNERLSRNSTIDSHRSESKNSSDSKSSSSATNDGWLTVKTKRRSSLHWLNRFNQPTGYASLPTLALLDEDENDNKILKDNKLKTNDSKLSSKKTKLEKNVEPVKKFSKNELKPQTATIEKPKPNSTQIRDAIVLRQKSDLTGLKLKSLRKEYLKAEKTSQFNNTNSQQTDSMESEPYVMDMEVQTNSMFSQTINDLYSNCIQNNYTSKDSIHNTDLESEDIDFDDKIIDLLSCDELEEHDAENDEDQRKLLEEQESLERQIRELESAEIDVDTETDETDCEVTIDLEESIADSENIDDDMTLHPDENMSLEMRYQAFLSDMSIGERDATLATLQALVARHPGRAQELHQKLSSPSRRRSLHETLKKYQAKQARAQDKRQLLQKDKALKIQHLLTRVEDVKAAKQHLIEARRNRMEERLQRAAENRSQYLKDKIRKAHDEEEKLREILFIKNLEAQNKRLDLIESSKETEVRLQDLEQERQKRVEEKAAKEAAVERRRLELEKERLKKLELMRETRREREKRIGKMQEQKEKERQAMAKEKARGREERLQAKQAQEMADTKELQRKIFQKQQESARRHEENIEHIRQRAVELSIPTRALDEHGQRVESCDRGCEEPSDLSSTVSDVSREFTRAARKKFKKLKQRMTSNAEVYLSELQELPAHMRRDSEVPKLLNSIIKGGGAQGIERPLGQMLRLVSKAQINDFQCIWLLNGLESIVGVVKNGLAEHSEISKRAVLLAVQLYRNSCSLCPQIARHAVLGNTISILLDMLLISLQSPEETTPLHPVELTTELILACTVVLSPSNSLKTHPKVVERLPDILSYSVIIGLVDILTLRCKKIREPIENHQSVVLSILATLGLLTKFAEICPKGNDATKFLTTVKQTELFGTIQLLYSTIVPIGECLPSRTISLAAAILNLLVTLATLDITTFQDVLSDESMSLKFLDVASILLQYCGPKSKEKGETQAVIIDLIATFGFFCVNRKSNQNLLTSEQSSTLIKSLTKLPKEFNIVIYPALVTIIHDNEDAKKVLSKDFDVESLEEYKQSELAKKNRLVSLLK